jgi:prenyltransferase beta subunit
VAVKYTEQVKLAVAWLSSTRNPDSGWGLNPGQASSIVNTAEALYVLSKARSLPLDVDKSIKFLRAAVANHPSSRGPFIRYFAFGILGLLAAGVARTDSSIQECAEALRQKQVSSRGWSQTSNDQSSRVFPTFLALWTLQMVEEQPSQQTMNGLNWLLTIQKEDGGWGFTDDPNERSNATCTAYAIIVLRTLYATDQRVQLGKQWLLAHALEWLHSPIIGESVGGTDWYHCNPVWASIALLELGESVLSPTMRTTIAYFQQLFDAQVGGWRQSLHHVVNVRSVYWAVLALEVLRERLDLNDLAETQANKSIDRNVHPQVSLLVKGFGLVVPRVAFAPLVLGLSGLCVLLYVAVVSQTHSILVINILTAKLAVTAILAFASILLLLKWKDVVKPLSMISICLLLSIVVSIWLLENAAFINFLNVIAFLLGLAQIFFTKEK